MDTNWFANAIIYGVNIPTFQDSNGDGIGDIAGLTSRLDYLADLGVTCLWLLPFYPSPRRDNGYDVSHYYGVDPRLGTLDDVRELAAQAKARGIRLMTDLVVHHTSDRHPWFEAAKSDRHSSYRDYYIWSDERPEEEEEPNFPEAESGMWRYEPISRSYYHHAFYHFQPDLNFANTRVQEEVLRIMDFWLALGVSAFRLDAAPLIIGRKGLPGTEVEPSQFWNRIRAWLSHRNPQAALMAEANIPMEEINKYVNDGRGIHMFLNFWTNQTIIYALAAGRADPVIGTLKELPILPSGAQYVTFLRNLDELNIARLSESEQQLVYKKFGPRKNMQIYHRGIRRRLAPMLKGNGRRLRLAFSLMFAMPGAPMIVYGDEIGMGENLMLTERDSVRTPMQWNSSDQAGFSPAESSHMIHRMVTNPGYHFRTVNVADQQADPNSLWHFMKRLIATRKDCPAIGEGTFSQLDCGDPAVLAIGYTNKHRLVVVHNLSAQSKTVSLPIGIKLQALTEILSDRPYGPLHAGKLKLGPYGFRWLYGER